MRVGYYVQGAADEAFVWGLVERWCPDAETAEGKFRGSSRTSFRREIEKSLWDLRDDKQCDVLVVLTDSDVAPWREVRQREWGKVPEDCRHLCVYGVAERNIECWLAIDRTALARELKCEPREIPSGDPSVCQETFRPGRTRHGKRRSERPNQAVRVPSAHEALDRWFRIVPCLLHRLPRAGRSSPPRNAQRNGSHLRPVSRNEGR